MTILRNKWWAVGSHIFRARPSHPTWAARGPWRWWDQHPFYFHCSSKGRRMAGGVPHDKKMHSSTSTEFHSLATLPSGTLPSGLSPQSPMHTELSWKSTSLTFGIRFCFSTCRKSFLASHARVTCPFSALPQPPVVLRLSFLSPFIVLCLHLF